MIPSDLAKPFALLISGKAIKELDVPRIAGTAAFPQALEGSD